MLSGRRVSILARLEKQFCGPALLIGLLILGTTAAFSQMNTADITGVVSDPAGAIVPGATVVALELGTQHAFTSVTSDAGQYLLAQLPLGEYTLTVNAQGFKQAVQEHVALHVNDHIAAGLRASARRRKRISDRTGSARPVAIGVCGS